MSGAIRVERVGAVARVIIDRPARKNALTNELYNQFRDTLEELDNDASVKVILLRGAGDSFSAGNDVEDFLKSPPDGVKSPVFTFLRRLMDMKTPLIAAVDGPAVGIGATMLLHCDLVYATARATFQFPFVALGLCPEAGSSLLLPLLVGQRQATEWLLFADRFNGEEALAAGFINSVHEPEALHDYALERAQRLAALPPASVRLTRQLLRDPWRDQLLQVMINEGEHFRERVRSDEAKEAFTSFLEKRRPDFSRFS